MLENSNVYLIIGAGVLGFIGFLAVLIPMCFRKVVPTNEVHIVQKGDQTKSYGKDTGNGNVYYSFPSWIPFIGILSRSLPVSNFEIRLEGYKGYDKGRLAFNLDIVAFFRISDSNIAAQRVSSVQELYEQLETILQGSARTILAGHDIEEIMQERSIFGDKFTKEVEGQLANWGVEAVKNIELMDIKDAEEKGVIRAITEKKKSQIDMESRTEVAKNRQVAQIAEIEATRNVELQNQEAQQQIGLRKTQTDKATQLADEARKQELLEKTKATLERQMENKKLQEVKAAEINKEVSLVQAEQNKQVALTKAEQDKQTLVINAQAKFESVKMASEGLTLEGAAKAKAEELILLAPVTAQTTLAEKIGQNKSYQDYLIGLKKVEADQAIGVEQAKALHQANIKIIANSGSAPAGIKSALELFTSNGGMQVGAMLEGLAATETGANLLKKLGVNTENSDTKAIEQ